MNISISSNAPGDDLEAWAAPFLRERGYTVHSPGEERETWAVSFLRELGYAVHKHGPGEPPSVLAERLKVTVKHIGRRRKSEHCPEYGVDTTSTGRVLRYYSNPAFDAFLTAHLFPSVQHPRHADGKFSGSQN